MRSPCRPVLSASNGRDMLLKDPNYVARKEKERRRLLRLQQVRLRSAEAARTVRQRVRREQLRQIQKIANQELEKFRQSKTNELMRLEAEYQKALQDIGLGHEAVAEEIKFEEWKANQQVLQAQVAEVRGEHAMKVVQQQKILQKKLQEEKVKFKKSVKLAEDARAAELRARRSKSALKDDGFTSAKVIEVDLSKLEDEDVDRRRVRFEGHVDPNIRVREIRKDEASGKPGVEAAIQEEVRRRHLSQEQLRSAKMRGIAALKRAKMARQQVRITESFFEDTDCDSKIGDEEDLGAHVHQPSGEDEIDLVPSRGPSSSLSDSSISLHASVSRLPTEPLSERFVIGEVQGASGGYKSSHHQQQPPPAAKGGESRKTKQDDDFIARVLEGFEEEARQKVEVDVRVEEVSTLSSSSISKQSLNSIPSSSSSIDITRERFLSQDWQTEDIRSLIGQLRVEKQPDQQESQLMLRRCIEQLLHMKREEIENLSVTDTSHMESLSATTTSYSGSGTTSQGSGFASSTPASILSSSSGSSKSSVLKSVRFQSDTLDGSYMAKSEEEKKRKEIIEKTRISLQKVHAYYEEQRQRLEAQLEARRKQKRDKENLSPLSEGLLSSSSSSAVMEKKLSSSSAKDSSLAEDEPESISKKSVVRKSSHTMSRQMTARLNKSSSSGTTTSGSVATAELLFKLRQLEIPSLERPRARPRELHALSPVVDDLNTSADLMKASELDSDETRPRAAVLSSFHFSTDVDLEGLCVEKEVTSITLSSSSSS